MNLNTINLSTEGIDVLEAALQNYGFLLKGLQRDGRITPKGEAHLDKLGELQDTLSFLKELNGRDLSRTKLCDLDEEK